VEGEDVAIFRVQLEGEPDSKAECCETGNPQWESAVAAFALLRGLTVPAPATVKRWDAQNKTRRFPPRLG
jgi:hypothetical protein